jgi:hypothetical protein
VKETASRQNMRWSITQTTLWSIAPLDIVRKARDGLEALDVWFVLFQKAID